VGGIIADLELVVLFHYLVRMRMTTEK